MIEHQIATITASDAFLLMFGVLLIVVALLLTLLFAGMALATIVSFMFGRNDRAPLKFITKYVFASMCFTNTEPSDYKYLSDLIEWYAKHGIKAALIWSGLVITIYIGYLVTPLYAQIMAGAVSCVILTRIFSLTRLKKSV